MKKEVITIDELKIGTTYVILNGFNDKEKLIYMGMNNTSFYFKPVEKDTEFYIDTEGEFQGCIGFTKDCELTFHIHC